MERYLLPLALILIAAEIGGLVSERLRLTRVSGQIVAGLLIGPSVLGLVQLDGELSVLAGIGSLCVLAIAGLETDMQAMRSVGKPAFLAAAGGVALPMILGYVVVKGLGYDDRAALLCGAILTATSVGISAATLRELHLFRSRPGNTIIGAAIIDDVLGLVVLSLAIAGAMGTGSPINQVGAMSIVLAGSLIGVFLVRGRLAKLLEHLHLHGGGIAGLLGIVLLIAWVYESIGGLAAITGAYVAGAAIAGTGIADQLREKLVHTGETILIPMFLVGIGLSVDLRSAEGVAPAFALLFVVAVVGKVIGSGFGARAGGLDATASTGVGIGMIARGEVALVAATLAHASGAIDGTLYAASVLMALATTIVTPVALALWARRLSSGRQLVDMLPAGMAQRTPALTPAFQPIDPE